MFGIGFAELILVLLVAFLVVGPKDLPKVARWLARQVKKARALLRELKEETGWDELTKDLEDTKRDIDKTVKEVDITSDLRDASHEVQRSFNSVQKDIRKMDEDARNARK